MNYAVDDYTMGHILRLARESGKDTLIIDFTTGVGRPSELRRHLISEVPRRYSDWFWRLVESSGSDRSLVKSANLTLKYDLERTRPASNGISLSPYDCDVSIVDTRGKSYSAHFQDWWYVDRIRIPPPRLWWKPTYGFSSEPFRVSNRRLFPNPFRASGAGRR